MSDLDKDNGMTKDEAETLMLLELEYTERFLDTYFGFGNKTGIDIPIYFRDTARLINKAKKFKLTRNEGSPWYLAKMHE